jgi:hypothetical protein
MAAKTDEHKRRVRHCASRGAHSDGAVAAHAAPPAWFREPWWSAVAAVNVLERALPRTPGIVKVCRSADSHFVLLCNPAPANCYYVLHIWSCAILHLCTVSCRGGRELFWPLQPGKQARLAIAFGGVALAGRAMLLAQFERRERSARGDSKQ